jgi:hypothetical protein
MQRVKAVVQHAHDLRNIAITFKNPLLRQQLTDIADRCDRLAAEIATEIGREDGIELPKPGNG